MLRKSLASRAAVMSGALIVTLTAGMSAQPAVADGSARDNDAHLHAVDDGPHIGPLPTYAPAKATPAAASVKAAQQQAGRKRGTKVTAAWSQTAPVPVNTPVTVSGRVKDKVKGKRKVLLQQRIGSGWRTVDTDRTTKRGKYSLNTDTHYFFNSAMRVNAPRVRNSPGDTSSKQRVHSYAPYLPFGASNQWTFLVPKYDVRWNPCKPVTYRVNSAQGIPGSDLDVAAAIGQVSQATGLRFKYKGTTSTVPGGGGKWPKRTDLVISWNTPTETKWDLTYPVLARGGFTKSLWAKVGNKSRINGKRVAMAVRGGVSIDSTRPLPNNDYQVKLLMHEIGHAVGLGHYPNAGQIMDGGAALYTLPTQWGAGDLGGLDHVGVTGGCLKPIRR